MRVAIITESFPPDINGVAHSVVRVAEHLVASGHEPLVIAPEPASATALHAHGIERVWLWRRGVDTVRFDPRHRSAAVRRALAPGGEILVGYVGRLALEKRVDLLAPIATRPGVRLVIIGGGPAEPVLRKALPGAVFLGPRQGRQLARLYASLDVFVHSGPYETFGQTIQEAAASGLPIVAPAAGGPGDLVGDGVTGYLVPPLSADALAHAVSSLVVAPEERRGLGPAARAMVLTRSWSAIGDQLLGHYRDGLGSPA